MIYKYLNYSVDETNELLKKIEQLQPNTNNINMIDFINVKDYGAIGDGITIDQSFFDLAIADCKAQNKNLYIPTGVYILKQGLKLPSNIKVVGNGMFNTILKLHPDYATGRNSNVITNEGYVPTADRPTANLDAIQEIREPNVNIHIFDLQLDWNFQDGVSTHAGNPGGSCLLFSNCQNCSATRVYAKNPGMHCFDIANDICNPWGTDDSNFEELARRERINRSNWITLDSCVGEGASDDIFTTHHSDNITIKNCIAFNPKGKVFDSGHIYNTNCFEIDDGSKFVNVSNCYAYGGSVGFEIKGHNYSPAPQNVNVNNCIAIGNIVSYQIRHSGFYDIKSETARNVNISNCIALDSGTEYFGNDQFNDSANYPDENGSYVGTAKCRALRIYGYDNVNVTNFTAKGIGENMNKDWDNVIRLSSLLTNANLTNINIQGFQNAESAIYITNTTKNINLNNVNILNSSPIGLVCNSIYTNLLGINIIADSELDYENNIDSKGLWFKLKEGQTFKDTNCIYNVFGYANEKIIELTDVDETEGD